jgi:hypothetical protein
MLCYIVGKISKKEVYLLCELWLILTFTICTFLPYREFWPLIEWSFPQISLSMLICIIADAFLQLCGKDTQEFKGY